ncbi:DUF1836 domain-containing protein [Clostridium hydrogeniformans]|uniref:DUF1836 domain-containing protein n=1 Tax=Clostridium hydrogeniformans TaxID=349933 RepID=UPI000481AFD4|nr:DUF1836 domain-containing protein [Clostridium hydrogeniformans]
MDSKIDFNMDYVMKLAEEMSKNNMVDYQELPKYDLFLSQVIDYLNDKFTEEKYTNNIVQNYIKSDVISKPEDGKKRGYTKIHLVQLVLLSYMRPLLTAEEIKKVFRLAFNDINDREDDILSWEEAYRIFSGTQKESLNSFLSTPLFDDSKLNKMIENLELEDKDMVRIKTFIIVMSLIAQASVIKKLVQKIVNEHHEEFEE